MIFKRGQNWSIEMIVTSALFVTFFVIFLTFSFVSNSSDLRQAEFLSDELALRLLSQTDKASIVEERNAINATRLVEFSDLAYEELSDLFGISEDFCILLEDEKGNVIPIDGQFGIGSDNIYIDNYTCTSIV